MEKKLIFQTCFFDMHLHNVSLNIGHFTFIVLTIIVPVFDLGMTFKKLKSGNLYPKLRRNFKCHTAVDLT